MRDAAVHLVAAGRDDPPRKAAVQHLQKPRLRRLRQGVQGLNEEHALADLAGEPCEGEVGRVGGGAGHRHERRRALVR